MTASLLAELPLSEERELFAARHLGRECALGLGMDRLDALRVATAISELGREIIATAGGSVRLEVYDGQRLAIRLDAVRASAQWRVALEAAARVVDAVTTPADPRPPGVAVTLEKALPLPVVEATVAGLRARLAVERPASPAEELRDQNRELLGALEEVRAQRAELEVVNRELEETNKGVLALYAELSEEMDRTNQGVVALYAEIDDKNLQLGAASAAKSRFLRSISHELKTPVNSIMGLTGLLLDPRQVARLSAEHTEQVELIRASAQDLLRLVEELLDLAKAESGRLEPVIAEVSLKALFAELAGVTEPLLHDGVVLRTEITDVDVLASDADLLRHILRNLLSNAAKFTTSGSITLSAARHGALLHIAVRDTGLGIGPDDLPRIFEEFYQAKSPLHSRAKGTGLGLPFAQLAAGALGGRIEVESTIGAGSRFEVLVPLEVADA